MDYLATTVLWFLLVIRMPVTDTVLSNRTNVFESMTHEPVDKLLQCVVIMVVGWLVRADSSSEEFCAGETFRPRCSGGKNDVIVILTARYGRMGFGRCLINNPMFASMANNPLFVGCSDDVKHILDQQCSGLSECDLRISDQNFDGIQPCADGLKMHLEASFLCLKVAAESRHCTVPLTTEPQHIVGGGRSRQVQTDTVGCGTESQPWSIEALSGQRIAVSLIDFDSRSEHVSSRPISSCYLLYGHIVDKNSRTNKSICGNQQSLQEQRTNQKTLYVSKSNQLQIITNSDAVNKFIVRIEASGCSDLAPPSDSAWLKRVDDQITVGCYLSRQSWKLLCVNGVWTGTVGVCNDIHSAHAESNDAKEGKQTKNQRNQHSSLTELTALVAVVSAGLAVCFTVICIGVVCLRKQRRQLKKTYTSGNGPEAGLYSQENKLMNTGRLIQKAS